MDYRCTEEAIVIEPAEIVGLRCVHRSEQIAADVTASRLIDRHIIVLHGWNSKKQDMDRDIAAMLTIPAVRQRNVWSFNFETHRTGFDIAALFLKRDIDKQGYDFSDVIFVGYSLGGLVARQLVANGMACRALITICTPHDGILPSVPLLPADKGEHSMLQGSDQLNALNANARDVQHRERYHCYGFGFCDENGRCEYHDRVVSLRSALANNLVGIRYSLPIYVRDTWPGDIHHLKGMDPYYLGSVFDRLASLCE